VAEEISCLAEKVCCSPGEACPTAVLAGSQEERKNGLLEDSNRYLDKQPGTSENPGFVRVVSHNIPT